MVPGVVLYIWLIYALLDLTLGIRVEPVLGGLSRLKEMAPDTNMPMGVFK